MPRYNQFRRLMHKEPVKSFDELTDNPEWRRQLKTVYNGNLESVDLMTGLYAEPLPENFGFSETAFRVFILMASRRLKSDRFFTDDFRPEIYTEFGIEYIRKNTMLHVLRRHYPQLAPALEGRDECLRPVEEADRTAGRSRNEPEREARRVMPHRSLVMAMAALVCLLAVRITARGQPQPDTFADIGEHFSYGSVGTEERAGLPYWIWRVLPIVFADKLPNRPGTGYERLGFINGGAPHGRPIGTSFKPGRVGLVGLNCATCHAGTIRTAPGEPRRIVLGMPANQMDLQGYARFLTACASDPRFTASDADRGHREGEPGLRLVREPDLPLLRDPAHAQRHSRTGEGECLVRRAAAAGTRSRRHLQSLQGAPEARHARTTARSARSICPRCGTSGSGATSGSTGTATTTRSRSATRAPRSAPARRPIRWTWRRWRGSRNGSST